MIRLAMLVDNPAKGTFGNLACRLAVGLSETGRATTTLVCYRDDPVPQWLPPDVHVHRLGTQRASRSLPALVSYLRSDQPDAMLTRQVHVNIVGLATTAVARLGRRWDGHLILAHDHPAELSHVSDWRDNKWIVKVAYRFAGGVVAVSPTVRDDAIRWCRLDPDAVALVPNPIIPFEGPDPEAPHPWLEDDRPPVFLTTGRLVAYKRVDLLIEAFHEVRRRHDVRLLIVGEGPERQRLAEQIQRLGLSGQAQAVGWVREPRQFAARAVAFVLPSEQEGFAQVLTEAMSAGCPVITADALGGGPRFVTDNGRYGVLLTPGDRPGLVEAMHRMLSPEVRSRYADLGLKRTEVFSPLACATPLVDFLETL